MKRCLIAGCGDVGGKLAEILLSQGHEVWGIRRNIDALSRGVKGLSIDLTEPFSLAAIDHPLDWVFYTAAAGRSDEAWYRAIYVDGIAHLLTALDQHESSPSRLIFSGSTSVYGQNDGTWVDESSATEPLRYNGRILLEAEALLSRSPITSSTVRFGGIYGPGRTWLLRLVRSAKPCPVEPVRYSNRIHRDDAARALAHVASLAQPDPMYLAVDDLPAPFHEVIHWLADQMGLPRPPVETNAVSGRGGNKRVRNALLRASGFQFQYPNYQAGYRQVLDVEENNLKEES